MRIPARLARRVDALAGAWRKPAPSLTASPAARPSRVGKPAPRPSLVGRPAAPLRGVDPAGAERDVILRSGERHLVAFLTSNCAPCQALWRALREGARTPAGTHLVIVTPDPATESRRAIAALAPAGAEVIMSSRAWFDYNVAAAPWFALVVDGVIEAERHARSWQDVDGLVPRVG